MLHSRTMPLPCKQPLSPWHYDMRTPAYGAKFTWAARLTPVWTLITANIQTFSMFHMHVGLCGLAAFCHSWPHYNFVFIYVHQNTVVSFFIPVSCCTCLSFITASPSHHHVLLAAMPLTFYYWYIKRVAP